MFCLAHVKSPPEKRQKKNKKIKHKRKRKTVFFGLNIQKVTHSKSISFVRHAMTISNQNNEFICFFFLFQSLHHFVYSFVCFFFCSRSILCMNEAHIAERQCYWQRFEKRFSMGIIYDVFFLLQFIRVCVSGRSWQSHSQFMCDGHIQMNKIEKNKT